MARWLVFLSLFLYVSQARSEDIVLYAAGSLHGALTAVVDDYAKTSGISVKLVFGPSGLLTDRIEAGETFDLLASADMEHPLKLRKDGLAAAVVLFARNALCAFATPDAALTVDNFAERLLAPDVKLGTSTPKADPSGDYTWRMFALIDQQHPGALTILDAKAQKVMGGAVAGGSSDPNPIASAFKRGQINVMIAYCSAAEQIRKDVAGVNVAPVPEPFAITSYYGLAIKNHNSAAAIGLAFAILSPEGQATLERFGFARVGSISKPQ